MPEDDDDFDNDKTSTETKAQTKPPAKEPASKASTRKNALALPSELSDKKKIVKYVSQYGFTDEDRQKMTGDFSPTERASYAAYKQSGGAGLFCTLDMYIAALRMWHSGEFPLVKPEIRDLTSLKIV